MSTDWTSLVHRVAKPQYLRRPHRLALRIIRHWTSRDGGPRTVRLPWNCRLRIDPAEEVGASIWMQGIYDLVVTEALWRLLDPGATAVDGGANLGYMTSVMAARVGSGGRVLAFEPHPEVYQELLANLELLRTEPRLAGIDLEAHPAALSDAAGTRTLVEGPAFGENRGTAALATGAPGHRVPTVRLDEACDGATIDLLKLDVEGHEDAALRGAEGLLREGRIRHVVYELHAHENTLAHEQLRAAGYTTFGLGRRFRGPLLSEGDRPPSLGPFEPPSYLATRDPDAARRRFAPPGWRCL